MRAARKRIRAEAEAEPSVPECVLVQAALGRAHDDVETPFSKALFKFVVGHWSKQNGWSCKDITDLAFLITASKGKGVEHLALDPALCGANHSRKIKEALLLPERVAKECAFIPVPVWDTRTQKRTVRQRPIRNPLEVVKTLSSQAGSL